MAATTSTDSVLTRFREAVLEAYGDNIDRLVLFGSRARGDAGSDSDYDIAVFLKQPGELWDELGVLSRITSTILDDTGAVISAKPFAAELYDQRTPLMHEIHADGLEL
jgi:uncharacterized protein